MKQSTWRRIVHSGEETDVYVWRYAFLVMHIRDKWIDDRVQYVVMVSNE